MRRMLFLLVICVPLVSTEMSKATWASSPSAQPAEDLLPLYDGRIFLEPTLPSEIETSLLSRELHLAARRASPSECEGEIEVMDTASGSFTRPNARQRAFFYSYCGSIHNFADNGIAIVENGQVVAHVAYSAGPDYAIGVLPDINNNGLSEILIAGSMTNQGYTQSYINLIEFTAHGIYYIGGLGTYDDDCPSTARINKTSASRLSARREASPTFYVQTFTSPDCGETWQRKGAQRRIILERNEITYRRLK